MILGLYICWPAHPLGQVLEELALQQYEKNTMQECLCVFQILMVWAANRVCCGCATHVRVLSSPFAFRTQQLVIFHLVHICGVTPRIPRCGWAAQLVIISFQQITTINQHAFAVHSTQVCVCACVPFCRDGCAKIELSSGCVYIEGLQGNTSNLFLLTGCGSPMLPRLTSSGAQFQFW